MMRTSLYNNNERRVTIIIVLLSSLLLFLSLFLEQQGQHIVVSPLVVILSHHLQCVSLPTSIALFLLVSSSSSSSSIVVKADNSAQDDADGEDGPVMAKSSSSEAAGVNFDDESKSDDETSEFPSCQSSSSADNHIHDSNNEDDIISSLDPALYPMIVKKLVGEDDSKTTSTFYAYVRPEVWTYYRDIDDNNGKELYKYSNTIAPVRPSHIGISGRFTNLTPDSKILVWVPPERNRDKVTIAKIPPFETGGTATFIGHVFCFTPINNLNECEKQFVIREGITRYDYDPFENYTELSDVGRKYHGIQTLNPDEIEKYYKLKQSEYFAKQYKDFTNGVDYQGLYPYRKRPRHYMWNADYFGQIHTVDTKETHFVSLPGEDELLGQIKVYGSHRRLSNDEPRLLQEYRTPESNTLTMQLKVLSCAPRVFEIQNFLSSVEIAHLLNLATNMNMNESTVSGSAMGGTKSDTRTSKNSWLSRERSPIVDAIYRRAADLLHIDEALLRSRGPDEMVDDEKDDERSSKNSSRRRRSMAEALQVVHYDVGQQYTAHHDYAYPSTMDEMQATRFATLLLYLNEGMGGGETAFPRWMNAETTQPLKIKPVKGNAVLFYSLLPDGNMDDLSQHASLPVTSGEKWLINLWVWDPAM